MSPASFQVIRGQGAVGRACLLAVAVALIVKIGLSGVGAPFITIDDITAFEGGFLAWFGVPPPQRMYLESWIYGIVCVVTYVVKALPLQGSAVLSLNLVGDAYRDFLLSPNLYVRVYRLLMIAVDLATAALVAKLAAGAMPKGREYLGLAAAAMFALTYNTLWCDVVARPDTLATFFAVLGLYLFTTAGAEKIDWRLVASALALGAAAGTKLHAALIPVVLGAVMLRDAGFAAGVKRVLVFGGFGALAFLVAAGSPLFDPLLYVKLRVRNAQDDVAPWLHWGDQFITMGRGGGWLAIVVGALGAFLVLRRPVPDEQGRRRRIIAIVSIAWLVLFACIRQLRAYWMLPALPGVYALAAYATNCLPKPRFTAAALGALLLALAAQFTLQAKDLASTPYGEMRAWIQSEGRGKRIYVFGYDSLVLPKSTTVILRDEAQLRAAVQEAGHSDVPFIVNHLRLWEERARLTLYELLGFRMEPGFEIYDFFKFPPETFPQERMLETMDIVIVEDGFQSELPAGVASTLKSSFRPRVFKVGPGGGASGLKYWIYERLH